VKRNKGTKALRDKNGKRSKKGDRQSKGRK
jgi:hypothetical protein